MSEYTFREKQTGELQDDTIFIIFAELRRFDKELQDCCDDLEKMLYVIKNGWRFQNQPKELQDEIFRRLLEACDIPRFSEVKRNKYDKDMYDERRRNGELAAAREEGIEEGMEKGLEKGIEKGREEGRVEGIMNVARQMKQMGLPDNTIAEATGLSLKDIESL